MARAILLGVLAIGTAAMLRSQANMQISKPSDRTIVVKRTFAAARQQVFDALTRTEEVQRWFQPDRMALERYESDLRPGGTYRYVFRRPNGRKIEMRGVYREVDGPRSWTRSETYDFSPLELLVTTGLEEEGGKTVFTQTILYPSKEERDGDYEPVATSAEEAYTKLARYLESGK
jgi:uncharacterized protein YndB with AHSA1/START domain